MNFFNILLFATFFIGLKTASIQQNMMREVTEKNEVSIPDRKDFQVIIQTIPDRTTTKTLHNITQV